METKKDAYVKNIFETGVKVDDVVTSKNTIADQMELLAAILVDIYFEKENKIDEDEK